MIYTVTLLLHHTCVNILDWYCVCSFFIISEESLQKILLEGAHQLLCTLVVRFWFSLFLSFPLIDMSRLYFWLFLQKEQIYINDNTWEIIGQTVAFKLEFWTTSWLIQGENNEHANKMSKIIIVFTTMEPSSLQRSW